MNMTRGYKGIPTGTDNMLIPAAFIWVKASMLRHPGRWAAIFFGLIGIAAGGAIYHWGYKAHARDIAGTTIITEDGRRYGVYIPPKVGVTMRPFVAGVYHQGLRPAAGIELGRIHPVNFDLLVTAPWSGDELDTLRISLGPGFSIDLTLNTSAGATYQWEPRTSETWIGIYARWRF